VDGRLEQVGNDLDVLLGQPVRHARAAHGSEQRAVGGDERQICLAIAAVDGNDGRIPAQLASHSPPAQGRNLAFSAISRSASLLAWSYCPTSGLASSARTTRSLPPCSAASIASSS